MSDLPSPGDTVLQERVIDDKHNRLNVVPDSYWETSDGEMTVADDEFVTQSANEMRILGKHSADDVEREDGEWIIRRKR